MRRHPSDPRNLFRPWASAAHRRPDAGRPSCRHQALLERRRRSVVTASILACPRAAARLAFGDWMVAWCKKLIYHGHRVAGAVWARKGEPERRRAVLAAFGALASS